MQWNYNKTQHTKIHISHKITPRSKETQHTKQHKQYKSLYNQYNAKKVKLSQ
jgi:hypothetical protein